jgi:hypothetical protein
LSLTLRRSLPLLFAVATLTAAQAQFGPPQLLLSGPSFDRLQAVDLNGDGDRDLVWFQGTEVVYSEHQASGSFGSPQIMATVGAAGIYTLVDLNADGIMDLAWVMDQSLFIAYGTAGSTWDPMLVLPVGATGAITSGDVTGNGHPDILLAASPGSGWNILIFPNTAGSLGGPVPVSGQPEGAPPTILLAGELDGETGNDMLAITADGMAMGFMNNGDGSQWEVETLFHLFDYQFERPVLMDVDGDGDLDVAEANAMVVQWVENRLDEDIPFNPFTLRVVEPFTTAGIGSFGHPGCGTGASVVFIPSDPGLPVFWRTYLESTQRFSPRQELAGIPRGTAILLADMTLDGRDDLLVADDAGLHLFPSQLQPATAEVHVPALDTVCVNGPGIELPEGSPSGGTWSGTWVVDNTFHRMNVGGTATVPLAYTYQEPDGCPAGVQAFLRVVSGPVIQPFLGPVVCSGNGPFQMTSQPEATEWSGLSEGNILDLNTYDGGQIVAVYTDPTGSTCLSFMGPISVWNSVPADIQEAGPFCVNDGLQTILPFTEWAANNWGGDIAGTSGQGAIFDPGQGAGTYTVWLQRNPTGPQQCANSDTITIVVSDDIPEIHLEEPPAFCASTGPIVLDMAQPEGGIWTGPGVTGNVLDPALAGPGDHLLTYHLQNPDGCANSGGIILTLAATVQITHDGPASNTFCLEEGPVQLEAHPHGGEWSGPVSSNGIFDPATAGMGEHEIFYVYTDPNDCLLVNPPLFLTVHEEPVDVSIDPLAPVCLEQPPLEVTGNVSGIWSGAVEGKGFSAFFDPASVGVGTWTVILTAEAEGFCPGVASMDILVEVCSGLEELSAGQLLVAPNPTNGMVWLHLPDHGPAAFELADASGRIIRRWNIAAAVPAQVDLSSLATGLYHLQALQGGNVMRARLMKE